MRGCRWGREDAEEMEARTGRGQRSNGLGSQGIVGMSTSQASLTRWTGWVASAGGSHPPPSGFCRAGYSHTQGATARTLQSHCAEGITAPFLKDSESRTVLAFTYGLT